MTNEEKRKVDKLCNDAYEKIQQLKGEILILKNRLEIANDIGIRAQKLNRIYEERYANKGLIQ